MKKRSVTCEQWDVVVVPFPFTDRPAEKRRPALVISKETFNQSGHTVLAMITSAAQPSRPGDTPLTDYKTAGLHVPCVVRLKVFTLDNRLILRSIGHLTASDRKSAGKNVRVHLF